MSIYEENRVDREYWNNNSSIHGDNASHVLICFRGEPQSRTRYCFHFTDVWSEAEMLHMPRKKYPFSYMVWPIDALLCITKPLLSAKRGVQLPSRIQVLWFWKPETPKRARVWLRAWGLKCPFTLEACSSEPQRECGQANWGYLFYFTLFLLGLFFIEKPSGLWTINHLSERLISLFFPQSNTHPKNTPRVPQLYFHSLIPLPTSENQGNYQKTSHTEITVFLISDFVSEC